jgi:SPP1 gp7 family putative phage head morphogenesis protein
MPKPPKQTPEIKLDFSVKPEEAIRFLKAKGLRPQFSHLDNTAEDHTRDFMVAKMMDLDLLNDVYQATLDPLRYGTSRADFVKHLTGVLQEKGWWGKQEMTDPLTGELKQVQLGSARRLKHIFDSNMRSAYAGTHRRAELNNRQNRPYKMYLHKSEKYPRPYHVALNGKILRVDDPWWDVYNPRNGHGCKCTTLTLSEDELAEMGREVDPSPEIKYRDWKNPRTGAIEKMPEGVDPGFEHDEGKLAMQREDELAKLGKVFMEKVGAAPASLGSAMWQQSLTTTLPHIEAYFSQWVDDVFKSKHQNGKAAVVGVLSPEDIVYSQGKGIEPINAGILVTDDLLLNAKARKHEDKGQDLSTQEWKSLPAALAVPEAVLWDVQNASLLYVFPSLTDDRKSKFAVRVNHSEKGKAISNEARTAFKVTLEDLLSHIPKAGKKDSTNIYEVVRGTLE